MQKLNRAIFPFTNFLEFPYIYSRGIDAVYIPCEFKPYETYNVIFIFLSGLKFSDIIQKTANTMLPPLLEIYDHFVG
jgi:hypothetical protein